MRRCASRKGKRDGRVTLARFLHTLRLSRRRRRSPPPWQINQEDSMAIDLKPLDQQVIVITGASSGIGLATAQAAAREGAKLVLAARSGQTLDDVVQQLNAEGCEAISVVADVADRQQLARVAEAAISRFGRIDTWIN